MPSSIKNELLKASHRDYTKGFMFNDGKIKQNLASSAQEQTTKFIAVVKAVENGRILVEMRNRFKVGDTLEILSPGKAFNKKIKVKRIEDTNFKEIDDVKKVCQNVYIYTNEQGIEPLDILRM